MEQLRVDTRRVRECGNALDVLRSEFAAADDIARDVAQAVGHGGLAGTLEDFAGDWRRSRQEIGESLEALARTARSIADELERVDTELAGCTPEGTLTITKAAP